ncbi:helix-turn-helix domain-containing protein [bacterium]|nr:helix-turn-helix domain-containing protein [bacterium]
MTDQTNVSIQNLFNKNPLEETSKAQAQEEGAWMSVQEASNATGLSMGTLRRYVKARKLKSRRQGRSINSKLQVWITPDFLPDDSGQSEVVDFDDEHEATLEEQEDDEILDFRGRDQADQSIDSTLAWMREKLDERDAQMREKEAKIEALTQQLAGATYRNGYLEAEKKNFERQILLIEDKMKHEVQALEKLEPEDISGWTRFVRWFSGKQ